MLQLSQTPRWNGRHKKWSAVLMLFVALSLALFNSLSVFANNVSSNVFEIGDGNTIDSPSGAPFDWENFFDGSGSHGTIARRANPDAAHFQAVSSGPDMGRNDPSTFTTGSKDTLNISSGWQCTSSNNLGGKFDLLNAYVLNYVGPVTSGGTSHNVLLFGGERDSNNGDSNIGFWFLQDGTVACDSSGGTASFTGNHVNNDLFIVSSFTNGGSNSDIIVYRWVGGAAGHLDTAGEITGAPADCSSSNASNVACATVNSSALTSPHPPWQTHASGSQTLDTNEFFEGMLDLTQASVDLGIPGLDSICFTNSLINTRSSQEPGATIKDFMLVPFEACGRIRVDKHIDADPNDPQTFRYRTTSPAGTNHALSSVFDLDDNSNSAALGNTFDSNSLCANPNTACLNPGTYTVAEDAVDGWSLTGLSCDPSAACTINGRTATITLGARGDVFVHYLNKLRYKVYVVVCQQTGADTNTNAYPSGATIGGTSGTTALAGNSAAESLCNGTTPALLQDYIPGTFGGQLVIPSPAPIAPAP